MIFYLFSYIIVAYNITVSKKYNDSEKKFETLEEISVLVTWGNNEPF